jgi:hypothetical protein
MSVGQMSVGQMSISQMSAAQMFVGQMSVGQMSLSHMSVCQMSVCQMSVSQMSVGQMSVGQMVFDENRWNRQSSFLTQKLQTANVSFSVPKAGAQFYKYFYESSFLLLNCVTLYLTIVTMCHLQV